MIDCSDFLTVIIAYSSKHIAFLRNLLCFYVRFKICHILVLKIGLGIMKDRTQRQVGHEDNLRTSWSQGWIHRQ